jgi:hypothetical protein
MRDIERRVKTEILSVLKEFQLDYTEQNRSKHQAVEFYVNGKRISYTIGGGSHRAPMNARSELRNMILAAGGVPHQTPPKELNGYVEIVSIEPVEPPEIVVKEEPVMPPVVTPTPVIETEPEVKPSVVEPIKFNPDDSYLLYQPRKLFPGNVLVIELDHDMLAEKGNIVIVPLHKPSSIMSMSKLQFEAMFMPMEASPVSFPVIEHTTKQGRVIHGTIRTDLDYAKAKSLDPYAFKKGNGWFIRAEVPPEPAPTPAPAAECPITFPEQSVEEVSKPKRKRKMNRAPVPDNPYRVGPSSIDGVGPQLGRVLVAMAQVTDLEHKVDLKPSMFNRILLPHDRKQYAARLVTAIKMGFVERGLPLPESRGHHAKLTASGRKIAKKLKAWPWLYDGLDVPGWIS